MKIKKIKLTEAVNDQLGLDLDDSTKELAKDLQTDIRAASNGTKIGAKSAMELATALKTAGDQINADDVAVVPEPGAQDIDGFITVAEIKNRLTDKLDRALDLAYKGRRRGSSDFKNVLVSGLPGSAKTASIKNWAATTKGANGKPINLVAIDAKNPELYAYLCGYPVQDPDNKLKITQAASSNLQDLEKENSVLFLDEFNRQPKQGIRGSLLSLINEHKVTGENGKSHVFKNLLFTVVAINPYSGADDEGADRLNPAESARFALSVMGFNSDPDTTANYLEKYCVGQARKLVQAGGLADSMIREDIEALLREWDLGTFIVRYDQGSGTDAVKFEYDDETDQTRITDSHKDLALLSQRMLVQGLETAEGKKADMIDWVENDSRFLPSNVALLKEIILDYREPTFEELIKKAGLDKDVAAAGGTQQSTTQTATADDDDDDELDFGDGKEDDIGIITGDALSQDDADALNTSSATSKIANTIGSWMR